MSTLKALGFSVIAACFAAGCGSTVYVPGATGGDGGAGGTTETTTTTDTPTTTSTCDTACSPPANDTCSCTESCGGASEHKVSCSPVVDLQGNHKIECVCTVSDQFSGVCFEQHEEHLCDFDLGCCAKYFLAK